MPFAPGGPTDVYARVVGAELSKILGQPVVVDNRPGAGGNLGADLVAKSAPDGYSIVLGAVGAFAINATLYPKLPYDVLRDIVNRLSASIAKALQAPDVKDRLLTSGAQPVSSTPEEFTAFVRDEIAKWAKVVKASGAKAE